MTEHEAIKRRLLGVLNYDEIKERDRLRHLMQRCGISRYLAKRALDGCLPCNGVTMMDIAKGLDISLAWLWLGKLETWHPRTFRIHAHVLNYPKQEIDKMLRLITGLCAGQKKASNLADLIIEGKLSFPGAARLM